MNDRNYEGNTALIEAAKRGHFDVADLLIARGADVNAVNNDGNTALIYAVGNGMFSASGADEGTGTTADGKHGLFSSFLLQGLQGAADADGDGRITAKELHEYVSEGVADEAARANRRQNPRLVGDDGRVIR